jgi:hypothetical protein
LCVLGHGRAASELGHNTPPKSLMENLAEGDISPDFAVLSYDDTTAYEEQVPPSNDPAPSSLAGRIGSTKVYLLSESIPRVGKVGSMSLEAYAQRPDMRVII